METPFAFGFEDGILRCSLCARRVQKRKKKKKTNKNRMGRGDGMAEASRGALGSVPVYRVSFHQHLLFLGKVIKTT